MECWRRGEAKPRGKKNKIDMSSILAQSYDDSHMGQRSARHATRRRLEEEPEKEKEEGEEKEEEEEKKKKSCREQEGRVDLVCP